MENNNAEIEIKRLKEMIRALYNNPSLVDDVACRNCSKVKQCERNDFGGCSLSEDEAVEIFIRCWKGEPA